MLVLTRRRGQAVLIGEGVEEMKVTVLDIGGGEVRLGFDADEAVSIDREEIREDKILRGEV